MFPASKDEVFYDSLRKILKNNGIPGEVEMKAYSDFVVVMKQIVTAFYRKRLEVWLWVVRRVDETLDDMVQPTTVIFPAW